MTRPRPGERRRSTPRSPRARPTSASPRRRRRSWRRSSSSTPRPRRRRRARRPSHADSRHRRRRPSHCSLPPRRRAAATASTTAIAARRRRRGASAATASTTAIAARAVVDAAPPPPPPVEPPTPPLAAYDVGKAQPPLSVYPRSPPPARAPPVALPPRSPPRSAPTTPRRRQSSTLRSPPRSPTTPRRQSSTAMFRAAGAAVAARDGRTPELRARGAARFFLSEARADVAEGRVAFSAPLVARVRQTGAAGSRRGSRARGGVVVCTSRPRGAARRRVGCRDGDATGASAVASPGPRGTQHREGAGRRRTPPRKGRGAVGARRATRGSRRSPPRRRRAAGRGARSARRRGDSRRAGLGRRLTGSLLGIGTGGRPCWCAGGSEQAGPRGRLKRPLSVPTLIGAVFVHVVKVLRSRTHIFFAMS